MLYITFRLAKEAGACAESYKQFARHVGGITKFGKNTPLPLTDVVEVCGFGDALWALRCTTEPCDRLARLFACDCAEHVLPIFEQKNPGDKRPRKAIEVSRRYANGEATREELDAAGAAAEAAAGDAAEAAAEAAAGDAAWYAAWAAAGDAAWYAERDWQKERFLQYLNEEVI